MPWKKSDRRADMAAAGPAPEPAERPIRSGEMDAEEIRAHMEEVERRVAEAERLADSQRALVASLDRAGHDATEARRLLRVLEQQLALDEADRDRFRRELAALKRRG